MNTAFLLGCAVFFISCEEDIAKANAANKKTNFPSQVINNANIVQRDSGMVKIRATVPLLEKFELIDSPYVLAKKGINIDFYDKKNPKKPGNIKANYAKFYELKKLYEARGKVRIKTNENQLFAMESVYWDQAKREIYTKDTVYVTDKDGNTLVGVDGMRAKDDFSSYIFYNNSGTFDGNKLPNKQK